MNHFGTGTKNMFSLILVSILEIKINVGLSTIMGSPLSKSFILVHYLKTATRLVIFHEQSPSLGRTRFEKLVVDPASQTGQIITTQGNLKAGLIQSSETTINIFSKLHKKC